MAINSLSLCLFGYILITPSLLKDILLVIEFLVKSFFSFGTLNISTHCLLASKVSCVFQDCLFVFQQFDYIMSVVHLLGGFLLEFGELLGFLDSCFSLNLGGFW